jgi:hypothetical protein
VTQADTMLAGSFACPSHFPRPPDRLGGAGFQIASAAQGISLATPAARGTRDINGRRLTFYRNNLRERNPGTLDGRRAVDTAYTHVYLLQCHGSRSGIRRYARTPPT